MGDSRKRSHVVTQSPSTLSEGSDEEDSDDNLRSQPSAKMLREESNVAIDTDSLTTARAPETMYSGVARKMMEKMGYKSGKGLGRLEQGRADIIPTVKTKGRKGLGNVPQVPAGFEPEALEWNIEKDQVSVCPLVEWMPPLDNMEIAESEREYLQWIEESPEKLSLDDEIHFCHQAVLQQILKCKSAFDELDGEEMRQGRTRSNPFETIRSCFFLNRAAMKMAEIDAVFERMFSRPTRTLSEDTLLAKSDILYFADVCAGPGGFSEYVLWRRLLEKGMVKGFGFTLKGENDFKLENFHAAPCDFFEPHYGSDGDGDIFKPHNQKAFRDFVMESTNGRGVHFVMADGGFSVEGQENLQEILSKRLYLCQALVAISILQEHGNFVCKLFDLFTPFSVSLIYLLRKCFTNISIYKPNTSRPANSERYIVCRWFLGQDRTDSICRYLHTVNVLLGKGDKKRDVRSMVPLSVMKDDEGFLEYITRSNEEFGRKQIINLAKIRVFCKDNTLLETRQGEMRRRSLELWEIPDKARMAPRFQPAEVKFRNILEQLGIDVATWRKVVPTDLTLPMLHQKVHSPFDFRCIVLASVDAKQRGLIMSMGRSALWICDGGRGPGDERHHWTKVAPSLCRCELPRDTLLYGEFVTEYRGPSGPGQKRAVSLHIIDAFRLGGVDICHLPFEDRQAYCRSFALAVTKLSASDLALVRVKEVRQLADFDSISENLHCRAVKGATARRMVYEPSAYDDQEIVWIPGGVLFLPIVKLPWMISRSRSQNQLYWYNTITRQSFFECPREANASTADSISSSMFWAWQQGVKLLSHHEVDSQFLQKTDILEHIRSKLPQP
ncbi:unnamed protein product [Cyprideis torosa]|uniref:Cap-specific mRNA (nucleoside-2'-O-)-methyltransferase 1 n=1 Tax=Cyprideis torosa TaxID=163714 RepID=A0A7R8W3H1_9CRUS|nr:unnamed protein product [Cyprideis torosa]CAG0880869.1 unnamed protein product [Cyprideis torosa]